MYKAKNIGNNIPSYRTPARIGNQQEYILPHRTHAKHFANQTDIIANIRTFTIQHSTFSDIINL